MRRLTQQLLAAVKGGSHIGALCQLMYGEGVVAIRRIRHPQSGRKHGTALTATAVPPPGDRRPRDPIASSAAAGTPPPTHAAQSTPSSASSRFTVT